MLSSISVKRISLASDGTQTNDYSRDPFVSANGDYITFSSNASNLVTGWPEFFSSTVPSYWSEVYVFNSSTGGTELVSLYSDRHPVYGAADSSISADGRYVVFVASPEINPGIGDDIYVRDRVSGTTTEITTFGTQFTTLSADPSISSNGRYIAFQTPTPLTSDDRNILFIGNLNLLISITDVYVYDQVSKRYELISRPVDGLISTTDASSADGRYVAFVSQDYYYYISGHSDPNTLSNILVRDRVAGTTTKISVGVGGTNPDYARGMRFM